MALYPKTIKIETTNAELRIKTTTSQMQLNTQKMGMKMKNHPIKMSIDNRAFWDSVNIKSIHSVAKDRIALAEKSLREVISRYAQQKNAMLSPQKITIGELQKMRIQSPVQSVRAVTPSAPSIEWKDGYVDMDFQPDKLNIEWTEPKVEMEYIPYKVEISVDEWVEIPSEDNETN